MARENFAHLPRHKQYQATSTGPANDSAPVVIVGGGPVGLTAALDLGQRGHRVVLLNQLDFIAAGSKAICFAKRTLDIWNRLEVGQRMVDKGVIWNVGKVFRGAGREPIFEFDVLPVKDQEMPGFINLQQYWAEEFLVDSINELHNVELRWGHQVSALDATTRTLTVDTEDGQYTLSADWIIASDGCHSPIRMMLGLDFEGRVFEDNFLIADVKFKDQRPSERWFWFDPPWGGASSLLHKQPDDVWRLDFQLGWDVDREAAVKPDHVEPLVRGMIGNEIQFSKEWYSVYTFQCRRMARFVHGRIIFIGDSAHLVSPFGARGCNGGIADADNLIWKLDAVIGGANSELIETYNDEAVITADENILNSSRSTDFMTPKSPVSQAYRDAVLDLATHYSFARPFVNSGRLSTPVCYPTSSLVLADTDPWTYGVPPGQPAIDAPLDDGWLLKRLGGHWSLLTPRPLTDTTIRNVVIQSEFARQRYGLNDDGAYLIRPDQYVAARWKHFTPENLEQIPWLN